MATYVLVPGMWLGGWAWQDVAEALRAAGHRVYPVTLTGVGERSHLGGPQVTLDTHITDVVGLLHYEDLRDVVLAGHSYAGTVVAAVADRVPERIGRLVYVDTWPLPDGMAHLDTEPPESRQAKEREVAERGEGWRVPMPPWEELGQGRELDGLGEAERRRVRERATDHPFGSLSQPVRLKNPARAALPKTVIWCSMTPAEVQAWVDAYPTVFAELAKPGWQVLELPTGHWPMFSRPADLAALLGRLGEAEPERGREAVEPAARRRRPAPGPNYEAEIDLSKEPDVLYNPAPYSSADSSAAGGPPGGPEPQSYRRSDDDLRYDVEDRLAAQRDLDSRGIRVDVRERRVTLRGAVPDERQSRLAEEVAGIVAGVDGIENELTVGR